MRAAPHFGPIHTRRPFEVVIEQITEAIRVGELGLGDRLPSERALAARMAISRPTLREAVKILHEVGVLDVRVGSNGGMFVKNDVVPRALVEERSRFRLSEVAGVLEARRALEPRVAEIAANRATEGDYANMLEVIALHRASPPERARIGQFDLRFHMAIARATRNASLIAMMKTLHRDLEVVRDMVVRDPFNHRWTITIHEATVAAMRSRDRDAIGDVMNEHLSFLEHVWHEEMGLRGLPAD